MSVGQMTRRAFLGLAALCGVVTSVGCPLPRGNGKIAYKRSGRGGHVSNAAKAHNANHLYATYAAAEADPAHPGDKSKVVRVTLSPDRYADLFRYRDAVEGR